MLILILMILALCCFVAAAFGVATRIGLVPAGLALVVLAYLLSNANLL